MKSISDLKKFFGQIMNTKILVIIFIVGIGLMMLPSGGTKEKKEVVEQQISGTAYKEEIEKVVGKGSCHILKVRKLGGCKVID